MGSFYGGKNYEPRLQPKELIDWRAMRAAELAVEGESYPVPLRFHAGEYDIEITPETGGVVLNSMSDDMDYYWVLDIRDGMKWVTFRSEMGDDNFKSMLQSMQFHGKSEYTYEPTPATEDLWRNRQIADVSRGDSFPAEWLVPPETAL
jgi:hypothetical protein